LLAFGCCGQWSINVFLAFQLVLINVTGPSGWVNVGKWSPAQLFQTLRDNEALRKKFDKLRSKYSGSLLPGDQPQWVQNFSEVMSPDLHTDGYQIYSGLFAEYLTESPDTVAAFSRHALSQKDTIFNNAGLDDPANDGKRFQKHLSEIVGDEHVDEFRARVQNVLQDLFPYHIPNDPIILRSDAGCLQQIEHADYPPTDKLIDAGDSLPLACVIALMPNTYFEIWPGAISFDRVQQYERVRLTLNTGDMLKFRGDIVHAGAAFDQFNVRLHFYMDTHGVSRQKNVTYYANASNTFFNIGK